VDTYGNSTMHGPVKATLLTEVERGRRR
jgi:hypothetical protein